jgi:hypothetical protein
MYAKRTPQLSTNNYQLSTVSELLTDKLQFIKQLIQNNKGVISNDRFEMTPFCLPRTERAGMKLFLAMVAYVCYNSNDKVENNRIFRHYLPILRAMIWVDQKYAGREKRAGCIA